MPKLSGRKHYLQVALNSTLEEARQIIAALPVDERIIVEAGTPLIKRYGEEAIRSVRSWVDARALHIPVAPAPASMGGFLGLAAKALVVGWEQASKPARQRVRTVAEPFKRTYVVADIKAMDRGGSEVEIAKRGGADAVVALGSAPTETLDAFIKQCEQVGLDSMVDMMNVEFPIEVLRKLRKLPQIVVLHRGVDEEQFNREKQIPYWQIQRIKGTYNVLVAVAGGDTLTEVRRAAFNGADIVVVWKAFFQSTKETAQLAVDFLRETK